MDNLELAYEIAYSIMNDGYLDIDNLDLDSLALLIQTKLETLGNEANTGS